MKTPLAAALLTLVASASLAAVERPQDRWNLADLYPTVEVWNADAAKLEGQFQQLAACAGHLGESARRLRWTSQRLRPTSRS